MPTKSEIHSAYNKLHDLVSNAFYKRLGQGLITSDVEALFERVHTYAWDTCELALIQNDYQQDDWMDEAMTLKKSQFIKDRLAKLSITALDVALLKSKLGSE